MPTDVVRAVFRHVDFELFTKGDHHLQRYMMQHDMLVHPQYAFVWAVRHKHVWTALRLQRQYDVRLPPGLQMRMFVPAVVHRTPSVYDHILRGEALAALEGADGTENSRLLKSALERLIHSGLECPDAWKLVQKWPDLGFTFAFASVTRGNLSTLKQLANHRGQVCERSWPYLISYCLSSDLDATKKLLTLKRLWRHGARYEGSITPARISDASTFKWCVAKGLHRHHKFLFVTVDYAVKDGFPDILEAGLLVDQEGDLDLDDLSNTAAMHGHAACLRLLIQAQTVRRGTMLIA